MNNLQFISDKVLELKWEMLKNIHLLMQDVLQAVAGDPNRHAALVEINCNWQLEFRTSNPEPNVDSAALRTLYYAISQYSAVFKDFYPLHSSTYRLDDFFDTIHNEAKTTFANFSESAFFE